LTVKYELPPGWLVMLESATVVVIGSILRACCLRVDC
jgi:hypothetical protein